MQLAETTQRPQRSLNRNWQSCVVAATGPSFNAQVARECCIFNMIAVNDAYRLAPWAEVLYACDASWWDVHKGCPDFHGEKWSSHDNETNNKTKCAKTYGLHLVPGHKSNRFSLDDTVSYGSNSGFQAINLAILFGATYIVLVGFNMCKVNGKRHFFGNHPEPLRNAVSYEDWLEIFTEAASNLPEGIRIVNATPDSALDCFPKLSLEEALRGL